MFFLRLLAGAFLLLAALALIGDVTRSMNTRTTVITSTAAQWRQLSPQSLTNAQNAVSKNLHPLVWDPLIWRLLLLPAWFLFGSIGLILALLGRRRRRANRSPRCSDSNPPTSASRRCGSTPAPTSS